MAKLVVQNILYIKLMSVQLSVNRCSLNTDFLTESNAHNFFIQKRQTDAIIHNLHLKDSDQSYYSFHSSLIPQLYNSFNWSAAMVYNYGIRLIIWLSSSILYRPNHITTNLIGQQPWYVALESAIAYLT